jgi:hypothetical protein
MTDEEIRQAARGICSLQADNDDWTNYLNGNYDHTIWMRLVEQGIRRGLEGQAMVKTQHCPNCEATEQKLHDFQQKVSDAAKVYNEVGAPMGWEGFDQFITPKPDPLVEVLNEAAAKSSLDDDDFAAQFRAALEARGLEIREKGQ